MSITYNTNIITGSTLINKRAPTRSSLFLIMEYTTRELEHRKFDESMRKQGKEKGIGPYGKSKSKALKHKRMTKEQMKHVESGNLGGFMKTYMK